MLVTELGVPPRCDAAVLRPDRDRERMRGGVALAGQLDSRRAGTGRRRRRTAAHSAALHVRHARGRVGPRALLAATHRADDHPVLLAGREARDEVVRAGRGGRADQLRQRGIGVPLQLVARPLNGLPVEQERGGRRAVERADFDELVQWRRAATRAALGVRPKFNFSGPSAP